MMMMMMVMTAPWLAWQQPAHTCVGAQSLSARRAFIVKSAGVVYALVPFFSCEKAVPSLDFWQKVTLQEYTVLLDSNKAGLGLSWLRDAGCVFMPAYVFIRVRVCLS